MKFIVLLDLFLKVSHIVLYKVITDKFSYHEICPHCMLKFLTDDGKTKKIGAGLTFIFRYNTEDDDILRHSVIADETGYYMHT